MLPKMANYLVILIIVLISLFSLVSSSPKYNHPYSKSPYNRRTKNHHTHSNFPTPKATRISTNYTPTWPSLDARPLPKWYDSAKIGIFLHWGVFSVPSFGSEWFWFYLNNQDKSYTSFMSANYPPRYTYQDFGRDFTAEFWDPDKWADLFQKAGAKYVVLTSKHHEGFTLWPSKYSFSWNAMDVGPRRDLVGDLANAVRNKTDIKFGLYHSWLEFFNPMYLKDKANGFKTNTFVKNKAFPEFKELVEAYKPELIWSDGDWESPPEYWKAQEFLAWLYNTSPVKDTVVVNDRWGKGTSCTHGGFFSCQDHYNPGHLVPYKWENAMTIDSGSWGYRRNAPLSDYRSSQELITELVSTVSCGGNFLINVGPTREGTISPIFEERLLSIGTWLGINGVAIYDSVPWERAQNDSIAKGVWYTTKPEVGKLFAILLEDHWPSGTDQIVLGSVHPSLLNISSVEILGLEPGKKLKWVPDGDMIIVTLPVVPPGTVNKWGWTMVINHV